MSVVLPVRNGGSTIREAVDSILDQSLRNIELVVVDDDSTDDTARVLATIDDPRVRVITNVQHRGLVDSLNMAIEIATGDLIARMDADNRAYPNRLELEYEVMRSRPEVGLVATAYDRTDPDGRNARFIGVPRDHASVVFQLSFGNCISHSSVMFRRDVVRAVGGYAPHEFPAEDYGLWLRMVEVTQVATVTSSALAVRTSPTGISVTLAPQQRERVRELSAAAIERVTGCRPERRIVDALAFGDPPLDCASFPEALGHVVAVYRSVRRASRMRGDPDDGLTERLAPMILRCGLRDRSGTLCRSAVTSLLLRHPILSARLAARRLSTP